MERVLAKRQELGWEQTNLAELAAFIAYAQAFPDGFLALVDTYDTLQSGVPNYICVAAVLAEMGHQPRGIRLDSGDLAYLSKCSRAMINEAAARLGIEAIAQSKIVASNDINEDVLHSLNKQGHEIDIFGVGTHLVTATICHPEYVVVLLLLFWSMMSQLIVRAPPSRSPARSSRRWVACTSWWRFSGSLASSCPTTLPRS